MRGWLSGYRVIDLTEERGLLASHMLAKLGADVIQVEPSGGSSARHVAPFDEEGRSYFWSAFAAGKRGIVLDLEKAADRDQLLELVEDADFLFESGRPGWLDALGLGYPALRARNPRLIHTSISAFGPESPKRDYADSDLIVWAAAGPMHPHRDQLYYNGEGPPLRMSVPQSYLHAAADAAVGALVALAERKRSGLGQHVDISAQQSVTQAAIANLAGAVGDTSFDYVPPSARRPGQKLNLDLSGSGAQTPRKKWRVKDGLVEMHLSLGPAFGAKTNNFFAWMKEAGELPATFADWDWVSLPDRLLSGEVGDAEMEEARSAVQAFLGARTKEELFAEAVARQLALAPIQDIGDLLNSPQLRARDFFRTVVEDGETRMLPGPFAVGPKNMFVPSLRAAPGIGEHDDEILGANAVPRARPVAAAAPVREPPFAGLKVLDLAWAVAGPSIGRTLADYGATVVRVDSSVRVDATRMMGPYPQGRFDIQRSGLFDTNNSGKLGMLLNLSSAEGQEVAWDLIRWADVLVESFAPGRMALWNLPPEKILMVNPRLIGLSTSLMGQTGPYASFSGYGNLGSAIAGFQGIGGHPDVLPVGPFGPYTDFVAPRFALVSLLAAMDQRERTGNGCWLDVSQAECGIQFLAPQIAYGAATGNYPELLANRDPQFAPHGAFACRDLEWVAIAVRDDAQWLPLARILGGDALNPALENLAGRKAKEDDVESMIFAWTADRNALEVERLLQEAGVPAHRVAASRHLVDDPQLIERGHFVALPHPLGGESIIEASRYRLSATPAQYRLAAPHFGRDTEHVLGSLLGYGPDRIGQLAAGGVLK